MHNGGISSALTFLLKQMINSLVRPIVVLIIIINDLSSSTSAYFLSTGTSSHTTGSVDGSGANMLGWVSKNNN